MARKSKQKANIESLDMATQPSLPTGWCWTTIGKAGEVRLGRQRSPKNRSDKYPTKYLRAANITWAGLDLTDVLEMDFKPGECEAYRLKPGDVLLSEASGSASEVGKPAIWDGRIENCCFQNTVVRFRPRIASSQFACTIFRHFAENGIFAKTGKGIGIHHLGADRFAQLPFPVPPLKEQSRIVAKIEELFSDLDAGVAALERAKAKLKRYRAAVLKAAIEGKLTDSKKNGRYFQETEWKRIDLAITALEQGWSPKCDRVPAENHNTWGVIKTTAVQPLCFLEGENKRLPDNLIPRPDLEIQAGDVLITRAGPRSRAAVTCLVRSARPRLIVCDKVYRLRPNIDVARPDYLELVLNAPQILAVLDELKTGISDSGVNLTQDKFRDIRIPFPPLSLQSEIVAEVELRTSIIQESESQIETNVKRSARLRQSILKRAFEGKLVPQDPNDEPASVLLSDRKNIDNSRMKQHRIHSLLQNHSG